ncbi:MAG: hypothetical protein ACK56I_23115, partial [bacterium]
PYTLHPWTSVVALLDGLFILFLETDHVTLDNVDDGVELVDLRHLLIDHLLLLFVEEEELIHIAPHAVTLRHPLAARLVLVPQRLLLSVGLVLQNLDLVLEDANLLLHLGRRLLGCLDHVHRLVA